LQLPVAVAVAVASWHPPSLCGLDPIALQGNTQSLSLAKNEFSRGFGGCGHVQPLDFIINNAKPKWSHSFCSHCCCCCRWLIILIILSANEVNSDKTKPSGRRAIDDDDAGPRPGPGGWISIIYTLPVCLLTLATAVCVSTAFIFIMALYGCRMKDI